MFIDLPNFYPPESRKKLEKQFENEDEFDIPITKSEGNKVETNSFDFDKFQDSLEEYFQSEEYKQWAEKYYKSDEYKKSVKEYIEKYKVFYPDLFDDIDFDSNEESIFNQLQSRLQLIR